MLGCHYQHLGIVAIDLEQVSLDQQQCFSFFDAIIFVNLFIPIFGVYSITCSQLSGVAHIIFRYQVCDIQFQYSFNSMILLFISLQIYMLHIEILHIGILLLLQLLLFGSSLIYLFGNLACINGFITMSISITSVKQKTESI